MLTTLCLTHTHTHAHTQTHIQTAFNRYTIRSAKRAKNCVQGEHKLPLLLKGQYSRTEPT